MWHIAACGQAQMEAVPAFGAGLACLGLARAMVLILCPQAAAKTRKGELHEPQRGAEGA
jgi:hypothetical protein